MKQGPRIAAAMAIGYALGRTRRMKLALMAGGVLAGRRMGGREELPSNADDETSSSALTGEFGALRDRLVDAARAAAVAAASDKIGSLSDTLSERAADIRSPRADSSRDADEEATAGAEREQEPPGDESEQDDDSGDTAAQESSVDDGRDRDTASKSGKSGTGTRAPREPATPGGPSAGDREAAPKKPKKPKAASSSRDSSSRGSSSRGRKSDGSDE